MTVAAPPIIGIAARFRFTDRVLKCILSLIPPAPGAITLTPLAREAIPEIRHHDLRNKLVIQALPLIARRFGVRVDYLPRESCCQQHRLSIPRECFPRVRSILAGFDPEGAE